MAEELYISNGLSKTGKYEELLPQIASLIEFEDDLTANLANLSAALHQTFGWWWVGFYIVKDGELVLGPFHGPVACTRIQFGRGVCGTAWKEAKSQLVPDVEKFPGHIACSNLSVSEIVVPILDKAGKVAGVLDVDSEQYDVLNETDVLFLEKICHLISTKL
ncbi:MAG: GAF domain-containing protein [Bacteroidales bacterium]|nr:GAF domain-containing protein [Bacteroidales bacterium]